MKFRTETPADASTIHALTDAAFANMPDAEGDEAEFVLRMRQINVYIPELALVAETEDALIAHVMLTHLQVEASRLPSEEPLRVLLLAIISVMPGLQHKGIGSNLLRHALEKARNLDYNAVMVLGDPAFYSRFGFRPSVEFGLRNANKFPAQYAQALELVPGTLANITGTYVLPS